jgi:hypothetical protein
LVNRAAITTPPTLHFYRLGLNDPIVGAMFSTKGNVVGKTCDASKLAGLEFHFFFLEFILLRTTSTVRGQTMIKKRLEKATTGERKDSESKFTRASRTPQHSACTEYNTKHLTPSCTEAN